MNKFFIFSLFFFILFFGVFYYTYLNWGEFSGWVNDSDYYFHWSKSNGQCPDRFYTKEACETYSPIYHILGSFFTFDEWAFNLLPMIILIFLIPYLIYRKTKSNWSILIYFSSVLIFNIMYASLFAQMMFMIFFTLILYFEKFHLIRDVGLSILGIFSHREAIFVVIPLLLLKIFGKHLDVFLDGPFFALFGLPFTGHPDDQAGPVYFFSFSPLINWFFTLRLSVSKILFISFFFMGAVFLNYRTLLFIPILWAFWLPEIIEKTDERYKKFLIWIYLVWIILQFVTFVYIANYLPQIV